MRSDLVFGAYSHTPNRLQETTNDVFVLLYRSSAIARIPLKSTNLRRRSVA
jgi:hypothetical protein